MKIKQLILYTLLAFAIIDCQNTSQSRFLEASEHIRARPPTNAAILLDSHDQRTSVSLLPHMAAH